MPVRARTPYSYPCSEQICSEQFPVTYVYIYIYISPSYADKSAGVKHLYFPMFDFSPHLDLGYMRQTFPGTFQGFSLDLSKSRYFLEAYTIYDVHMSTKT